MLDLSIIIVSWNAKDYLQKCIDSIFKERNKLNIEVIVVDNASSDGSQDMIRNRFPRVKLICNSDNFGFAKANNIGIKQSKGKYLGFINSDVEILPNCLPRNRFRYHQLNLTITLVIPCLGRFTPKPSAVTLAEDLFSGRSMRSTSKASATLPMSWRSNLTQQLDNSASGFVKLHKDELIFHGGISCRLKLAASLSQLVLITCQHLLPSDTIPPRASTPRGAAAGCVWETNYGSCELCSVVQKVGPGTLPSQNRKP